MSIMPGSTNWNQDDVPEDFSQNISCKSTPVYLHIKIKKLYWKKKKNLSETAPPDITRQ